MIHKGELKHISKGRTTGNEAGDRLIGSLLR